jgi:hypothetical protein
MPLPLKCRCHDSNWVVHPAKIVCNHCQFTEHFLPHESLAEIVARMKSQGCYFLDKDKDKLKDGVKLQLTGYNYR